MTSRSLRDAVRARFLAEGGTWTSDLDLPAGSTPTLRWVNTVAWALAELRTEGRFGSDPSKGFYRLADAPEPVNNGPSSAEEVVAQTADDLNKSARDRLAISRATVLGEGPQSVYAYGYPGLDQRLKIGSAIGDPVIRILDQLGTASPAWPEVKLIVRCDDARRLEGLIHRWLTEIGRAVDAPGREWFLVTTEELRELIMRLKTPFARESG